MALPQPIHVEGAASRSWSPVYAQHALLFLSGIIRSLRSAAEAKTPKGMQYLRKARELELELSSLVRAMREHPIDLPGAALSVRLCTLLACESEAQLAETLAVPLSIVLAGRARMYALAESMVAAGNAEGAPPLSGPSPTNLDG